MRTSLQFIPLALWLASASEAAAYTEADITASTVQVESGHTLHYLSVGEGRPVVLLHGLGGSSAQWRKVMPLLALEGYRVIALDQLGFGASAKPKVDYRIDLLASMLEEFLHASKIDRPILVGNSLGGWVSAQYALKHPEKVRALVLVAAGFGYAAATDSATLPARATPPDSAALGEVLRLIYVDSRFTSEQAVQQAWAARQQAGIDGTTTRLTASILRREDVLDGRLFELSVPTLVLAGARDRLTPMALSERLAQEIAGARLQVFANLGHSPQVEGPKLFSDSLIAFIHSLPSTKSGM